MAEGNENYMGLAVPLYGESEIQAQTAATDILTLTGASSHTGDFLVLQNSTGAELAYVDITGKGVFTGGLSISGSISVTAGFTSTVSSTTQVGGLVVSVTSTGALADVGVESVNGVVVTTSSKAVLNAVFMYNMNSTGGFVGSAVSLLGVSGTKAPSYFLKIGASADYGQGAATTHGFLQAPHSNFRPLSLATTTSFAWMKVLAGSASYWIPLMPSTNVAP